MAVANGRKSLPSAISSSPLPTLVLRNRLITAIVLLSLVNIAIRFGGVGLGVLMSVGFLVAGFEYFKMCEQAGYRPLILLGLILMAALMYDGLVPELNLAEYVLVAIIVIPALIGLRQPLDGRFLLNWSLLALGVFYMGGLGSYVFRLAKLTDGLALAAFALGETWMTDAFAFFVGSRWGRRPFFQHISPKKTWEGALGGIVGGMIGIGIVAWLYGFSLPFVLIFGFVVAVASIFGDLAESLIKRQLQIKDSGALLAGHGGLFDRLDSSFWAVVFAYYCAVLLLPLMR